MRLQAKRSIHANASCRAYTFVTHNQKSGVFAHAAAATVAHYFIIIFWADIAYESIAYIEKHLY